MFLGIAIAGGALIFLGIIFANFQSGRGVVWKKADLGQLTALIGVVAFATAVVLRHTIG